ncbi:MAG: hypothetical protein FJ146_09545 [Deltaproteobacteria bacterium]|nr:hypothetical protein [Deltaproteobacteria bacterium]
MATCMYINNRLSRTGVAAAIALALSTQLISCMAKRQHDERLDDASLATPKVGSKTPPAGQPAPVISFVPVAPTGPGTDEQLGLYLRLVDPGQLFTDNDRQLFARLPLNPPVGSLAEAIGVLAVSKIVLQPRVPAAPTFQESDIVATGPEHVAKARPVLSLEQLAADHGVDMPKALQKNPWLSSQQAAAQVLGALNAAPSSANFTTAVQAALRQHVTAWQQVGSTLPAELQPTATAPTGPAGPPVSAQLPGPPASAAPGAIPVLGVPAPMATVGENALDQAQALADKGDFQAAVQRAGMIPVTSPAHAKAQEKIKEFSNLGVQELRRKAAQAFQTARPIADPKTRAIYLKQAKNYLEDALKHFPEATQLTTVRENLQIIAKDLDKASD